MSSHTASVSESLVTVHRLRDQLAAVRNRARKLFSGGATGIQVTAALTEGIDDFVRSLIAEALEALPPQRRTQLQGQTAVVAIGGTGRGDAAPYSDVDLLFLNDSPERAAFEGVTAFLVRGCWDSGLTLGHAVRSVRETLALAKSEIEVATALIEARLLWGSRSLYDHFRKRFARLLLGHRCRAFLQQCIAARDEERRQHGGSATQLEPDVKKSSGGLRDIHLIRWLGFCVHGTADLNSLRLKGMIRKNDARRMRDAYEFLLRIRCDLHLNAGKAQDVLTREEQLRLAEERNVTPPVGQRPVEAFMQTYFRHSTAIAQLTRRIVSLHQPVSVGRKILRFVMSRRLNSVVTVRPDVIDVSPRALGAVCRRLEDILRLFRSAAWHGVDLAPPVVEAVAHQELQLDGRVTPEAAALFVDALKRPGHLGPTLRTMHETSILQHLIPGMAHARCLLQFNQYHHYTVDEHTLRAIEAVEAFEADDTPLGTAYRAVRHKEILHLALLLHDLGKGYGEDHSNVGRALAEAMAQRLFLPDHHRETLVFLVHKHLRMSHLAFRRDCSDPDLLMEFARDVGSPETLRMLYVLTAADLTAVGPGVFTKWKDDLLTDLYERAMLVVSGTPYRHHEQQRIAEVKQQVQQCLAERFSRDLPPDVNWIARQLEAFPAQYLSTTPPQRIARDLDIISRQSGEDIFVEGSYDVETKTVDYRVIVPPSLADGCFHRLTGALTAKRLEILSAQICTTTDGTAVDMFRVLDADAVGDVSSMRIDEVSQSLRAALRPAVSVESMFRKYQRFGDGSPAEPISDQTTRVVIDNDSSEHSTVIDVFAHDRRGLLYTLTRTICELGLSVMLAKISTHLDQVVDVFYVTDSNGRRIRDGDRLKDIRSRLLQTIDDFERDDCRRFLS